MKSMFSKNKYLAVFISVLAAAGIFYGGLFLGQSQKNQSGKEFNIINQETGKQPEIDFAPFWTAWDAVNSKYVSAQDLDGQKMVWGAIEGMVKSLGDPYSVFFPPQENKEFKDTIRGNFGGVGMEIGIKGGTVTVISPLKGTPAYRAGIKAGDKILKIGDKTTLDMTAEEAARLIRGEKGTAVKLLIFPKGEETTKEITLTRDTIIVPILETEEKPGGIFLIKFYSFSGNSTNEFRNALRDFVYSGNGKMIIDLRGNPGGFLESAVDATSWFLPIGKTVAREKFGNGEENVFRSKGYNIFNNLPLAILVNEGSASASEIMAGALQEHNIAKLVGTKTFGKGSVQELVEITPQTSLKITIAKWLTPNGVSISDQGLEPDFKVEITKKDLELENDPQMEKAKEVVNNWKK